MLAKGDTVRVIKRAGTCCGVGCCGTTDTIVQLYFTSSLQTTVRDTVYELQSGLLVKRDQLEKV